MKEKRKTKQKIPKEIEDKWKETLGGWKERKTERENAYSEERQKIHDVWLRQNDGGYPPPIRGGFFWAQFFCPSCHRRLDLEECVVGTIAICPECEYSYLEVSPYQARIFIPLMDELDEKGKNTELVY